MPRILPPDAYRILDPDPGGLGRVLEHPDRTVRVASAVAGVSGVRVRCEGVPLGGVALYLDAWEGAGLAIPPGIAWELRATYGAQGETLASGVLSNLATLGSGSIVRVTGCLAEGFEFWARVTSGAVPVTVRLRWMVAPASAGAAYAVTNGTLV